MSTEVKVPTLGESVAEATIGEWLKQPGEAVALDEPVASLETDKVAVEVGAPAAGVMGQHIAKVGDNVAVGAVIATIEAGTGTAPSPAAIAPAKKRRCGGCPPHPQPPHQQPKPPPSPPLCAARCWNTGSIPPRSRALARTAGSPRKTCSTAAAAKSAAPAPAVAAAVAAPAPSGDRGEERVKMTRLRQTIAKRLKKRAGTPPPAHHLQRLST
jgi:2-oxoglutarate dehydrogenase E2 component (dihydrolipoamide succinyltransferase)